jgi:hypothetical protein
MVTGLLPVPDMTATLSTAAQAFRNILQQQAAPGRDRGVAVVLPQLAELSPQLSIGDAMALGFWKAAVDRSGAIELATGDPAQPRGLLVLAISPEARHVAMAWSHAAGGLRLWIDGQEQHPPCSSDGAPLAADPGWWCSERFYALHVAVESHALQDWRALPGTGRQQALWLWDTAQAHALRLEPGPAERWPAPGVRVNGAHEIQILADRSLPDAAPVRTLVV